jgi:polyhydroxybutyrate depolymerase
VKPVRRICACIIAASIFAQPVAALATVPVPFPDMEKSWFRYRENVAYLVKRGGIEGYADGSFKPKAPINRAEFLTIVFRGRSPTEPVSGECFSDVPADAWYAPYVCAAQRRDIVKGYADGTYKPDQTVNIAEAMKMLLLAYDHDITERTKGNWYEAYASEFDREDILSRDSYLPWEDLNRERAADLLARMLRFEEDRTIANLSKGCGKRPEEASTMLNVGGMDRSYLLTVPTRYSSNDPHPLIVAFHGRTNSNERVRGYYGLDRAADDYVIAYPAALQHDTGTYHWSSPGNKISTLRDVAFFDAIVEELADSYCIDMDKIYVVGHSLGAWMANSVACSRGDVVRASATVGGDSMIAPCAGPAAAFMMHNPNDTLASFYSTEVAKNMRVKTNFCEEGTREIEPSEFKCVEYQGCDGGNTVVWCPHEVNEDRRGAFYPHQWPEGTGQAVVDFFEDLD